MIPPPGTEDYHDPVRPLGNGMLMFLIVMTPIPMGVICTAVAETTYFLVSGEPLNDGLQVTWITTSSMKDST